MLHHGILHVCGRKQAGDPIYDDVYGLLSLLSFRFANSMLLLRHSEQCSSTPLFDPEHALSDRVLQVSCSFEIPCTTFLGSILAPSIAKSLTPDVLGRNLQSRRLQEPLSVRRSYLSSMVQFKHTFVDFLTNDHSSKGLVDSALSSQIGLIPTGKMPSTCIYCCESYLQTNETSSHGWASWNKLPLAHGTCMPCYPVHSHQSLDIKN